MVVTQTGGDVIGESGARRPVYEVHAHGLGLADVVRVTLASDGERLGETVVVVSMPRPAAVRAAQAMGEGDCDRAAAEVILSGGEAKTR